MELQRYSDKRRYRNYRRCSSTKPCCIFTKTGVAASNNGFHLTHPAEGEEHRENKQKKAIPSGERPRLHYSIEGMFLFNVNDQNGAPGVTKVHKSVGGGMNREFRLRTASGHVGQGKHNNWAERISSTCVPVLQYGRLSTAVPACEYCSICQLIQDKRLVNIRNPQFIMERLPPPTDL